MKVNLTELAALPARVRELEERVAVQTQELEQLRASRVNDPELLLSVEQVAALLGRSTASTRKLVQRGRLPAVRRGRSVRVRRADAVALLEGAR